MDVIALTRGAPPRYALPKQGQMQVWLDEEEWEDAMSYGWPQGLPRFRLWVASRYGVTADDVFASHGSLQILEFLASMLLRTVNVFVCAPTYDRALTTFAWYGLSVHGVRVQEDGIDVEDLELLIQRRAGPHVLYLIPDFQNPTGATLSLEKRKALARLCELYGLLLIEDVPYRQLRYQGEDLPLMRELAPGHVITLDSVSKSMAPGMRVGFAVAGDVTAPAGLFAENEVSGAQLMKLLTRRANNVYISPNLASQATVASFAESGKLESHLRFLKALYAPRCEAAYEAVRELLPGTRVFRSKGGFFLGLWLPKWANVNGLVVRALKNGLELLDGCDNYPPGWKGSDAAQRFLRFPFPGLPPKKSYLAMERLATLL